MRTAEISIDGQKHLLCFSLRVLRAVVERYGSVEGMNTATSGEDDVKNMDEALWQLAAMMDAGARYAALQGIPNEHPLTQEELYDLCDIRDFLVIRGYVQQTITNGNSHSVEVDVSKNGEAAGMNA